MQDLNQFFETNGYVVIPSVLSADEVIQLRELLEELFRKTGGPEGARRVLLPAEILRVHELYSILFRSQIVSGLKQLLEERYTVFSDLMIQRNMFGSGPRKGWHTDSGSEGRSLYLTKRDYRLVKCGVFLQDNNREWGGAIDVVPGGHRFPFLTRNNDLNFKLKLLYNRCGEKLFGKTLSIRPGDFVAFDSRLPHTSTWPARLTQADVSADHIKNMPAGRTKFAIYWNACRTNCANDFLKNSERRAEQEEVQGHHPELFFSDYLRLKFPESYPESFVSAAIEAGVEVASLDASSARQWKLKYEVAQQRTNPQALENA